MKKALAVACILCLPLLSGSCIMTWEECSSNNDCIAPRVCQDGRCVIPGDGSSDADGGDSTEDRRDPDMTEDAGTDLEATCEGGCIAPIDSCYESPGECVDGTCVFTPMPEGAPCDDSDPCTLPDQCDGAGTCSAATVDCSRPHTTGGRCEDGACTGFECEEDWGNCSGGWENGCETDLRTLENCGDCDISCTAGDHAEAVCSDGACSQRCIDPWKNCDDDWSNGCEIPEGVSSRCDIFGLNSTQGCGTAWCGTSTSAAAQNFGTWHCMGCSHCHHFSDGYAWCLHLGVSGGEIRWSGERCDDCCGSDDQDLVCGP
jgi:hypothetical protein